MGQTRAPFFQAPPFLFERAFRAAHSVCARRPFFDKLFFPKMCIRDSLEPMAIVGMIYFSMTFVLSKLVRAYERRVSVG